MSELTIILISILGFLTVGVFFFLQIRKQETDKLQNEAIRDLERRLTDLMSKELKEIRGSVDGTSDRMHKQIRSFTHETTEIRKDMKKIQEEMKGISSFQEIFRSPKLRGQWGEANLEHLLSEYYPAELYECQYNFSSGLQVDAVLKLPNNKLLPIDAKFSSDNFQKMIDAEKEEVKNNYRKQFISDIKKQVDQIVDKYILPEEDTVDFALMYIPAEAIYYEIINNIGRKTNVAGYAWEKRVVLTSPNTFYLTLKTIEFWFRDTELSRHTQKILKRLERIRRDGQKLSEEFRKLGVHLKNASSAFGRSKKRLSLLDKRTKKLIERKDIKELGEPKIDN